MNDEATVAIESRRFSRFLAQAEDLPPPETTGA